MVRLVACLAATAALVGCSPEGAAPRDTDGDTSAIESALRQWPNDFNAENIAGVCGLFADDAVLAYPGGPARNRGEFCDQMQKLFDDPAKTFTYDAPDIHEVLVDGDLATVLLGWKLTVRDASGKVLEVLDEDGLDVFRRQPDGTWKIHISHAFTQE